MRTSAAIHRRHLRPNASVIAEDQFRPLSDQVRRRDNAGVPLPYIFVQAAAPAEGEPSAGHLETVDAAVHPACLADEAPRGRHLRCSQGKQVRLGIKRAVGPREGQERDAQRSHQFRAGRDHDRAVHAVGKGVAHGAVQGNAALQEHFLAHDPRPLDLGEIVRGDRIDQPGDDVLARLALLECDADVGIDERRAGRLELHRGRCGERGPGDLRHRDAEVPLGALFQERAGAGGAGVVHRVIDGHAVPEEDVLGVLAADLEDGVHVRVEVGRARGMGRDLVVHMAGAQIGADQFPGRAGGPDQSDPEVAGLLRNGPEALARRCHGIASRAGVVRCDHTPRRPDRAGPPWSLSIPHRDQGPAGRPEAPAAAAAR